MNTKAATQSIASVPAQRRGRRASILWTALALGFAGALPLGLAGPLRAAPRDPGDDVTWKAVAPVAPPKAAVVPPVEPNGTAGGVRVQGVPAPVQAAVFQLPAPIPEPKTAGPELPKLAPVQIPALPAAPPAKPLDPGILQGEQIPVAPKRVNPPTTPAPTPANSHPPQTRRTEDEEAILAAARNAYNLQKYDVAAERFERYLTAHPEDVEVRNEYAGMLITAGEPRRAAAVLERLVRDDPKDYAKRQRLGVIYIIGKDYRKAAAQFAEAIELNKGDPDAARRARNEVVLALGLAQAFAYDNDYTRAEQVYDRFLATIRPEDPGAPYNLGGLLLDLERPNEALAYLLAQKRRNPKNLEVLAFLVRAYSRLGERQTAMEQLTEMAGVQPENKQVRVVLGDSLFAAEEFEIAGHVYNQVLQLDPANGNALIGLARVHLAMFLPANAKKILDSFVPGASVQRSYLLTYAEYHQKVGEYTEAKLIYRDMLRRNELDHEVRVSLGLLLDYTKEWEKAKAEYAKVPPTFPISGKKARLEFATTLENQRKFQEALDVTRIIFGEEPNDPAVVAQMIRQLSKAGRCDEAVSLARAYLSTNPRSETAAFAVRLALAKALLESKRYLDASREYEIILSRPVGRVPAAYYGLARAAEQMGNPGRAAELIGCIIGVLGGDTRQRMVLADLYSADYADDRVIELCLGALQFDPDNLSVLIRLADALQRKHRYDGQPQPVFDYTIRILTLSPTNVRGHLAMARSFAIAQNYRKAAAQYDQLIQIDPEFTIPPRERARVLYSDHQFSAARSQYQAMLSPAPDQFLMSQLAGVIQRQPRTRANLEPYMATSLSGPALRKEMEKVACNLADEDSKLAVLRLVNDYDAKVAEQTAFRLEMEAKELKDLRNYAALPAYDAINRFEPTNTETLFDMGQVYGALKENRNELELYSGVQAVDPTHRDSLVAAERSSAELNPRAEFGYDYFHERGRDGLASIDRQRFSTAAVLPFGDEDDYVKFGYDRVEYTPIYGANLSGDIPWIRVQKRCDENRLLLYGQLNVEIFPDRFHTRPTFDIGANYAVTDEVKLRGGIYLENVAENAESLRQDIHRYGGYIGADVTPTRTWDFGGTYKYGYYSDHNSWNDLELYNEVSLTLPPKQLKLVQKYMFWGYSDPTVFPTNPPDPHNLAGTIHPYFAPKTYNYLEARIEWWRWFSRDYYVHSDQCWYSLQFGLGEDDRLKTYAEVKGIVSYDITSWLSLGGAARAQTSSVYRATEAMMYMTIRFK